MIAQVNSAAGLDSIADDTPEHRLAADILAELVRARAKFPGRNVTFAALIEEVRELAKATFEEPRAHVRKEAVQVAVMAMRMVLDGDHTFDAWRAAKGLDALSDPVDWTLLPHQPISPAAFEPDDEDLAGSAGDEPFDPDSGSDVQ